MYFCTECGAESAKWAGKCPACGAWNSMKESAKVIGKKDNKMSRIFSEPESLKNIESTKETRVSTTFSELDGTLGGGIVPGMATLIGGEPGVGKSTLMMQVADALAQKNIVLYVSGEESKQQIKMRSKRLNCQAEKLQLYCENDLERILNVISNMQPIFVVIDSIQSVYLQSLESSPGSISQLRECTGLLTRLAKNLNIPIFMVGHVTKDGSVAGPKIIEHMVDTVLYFEGEIQNQYKILRATKNRFGSTNEIGIFEMQSTGLQEVKNPSHLFLRENESSAGSAIGCLLEGSRAFLVEVQALVSPASYGTSQRVALGFDQRKLALLLAVIEKNLSINLRANDVFINIAGGLKVTEPAIDLAIIAAILSSAKETPLPAKTVFLGEVGLNGEIRAVSQIDKRLKEAKKLGYDNLVLSARNRNLKDDSIKLKHIRQLFPILFGK
jgi:DNA repair protein RadA/Sms